MGALLILDLMMKWVDHVVESKTPFTDLRLAGEIFLMRHIEQIAWVELDEEDVDFMAIARNETVMTHRADFGKFKRYVENFISENTDFSDSGIAKLQDAVRIIEERAS